MNKETDYENKMIQRLRTENSILEIQASKAHEDFYNERVKHTEARQWGKVLFWVWIVTLLCGMGTFINYNSLHKKCSMLEQQIEQLQPKVALK